MADLTDRLLATLPVGRAGLFNPWTDKCEYQTASNAACNVSNDCGGSLTVNPS